MKIYFNTSVNNGYTGKTNKNRGNYFNFARLNCDTFSFGSNQRPLRKINKSNFEKAKEEFIRQRNTAKEISQKYGIDVKFAMHLVDKSGYVLENLAKLLQKGFSVSLLYATGNLKEEEYVRLQNLLDNGADVHESLSAIKDETKYSQLMASLTQTPNEIRDFYNSEDCLKKLEEKTKGNYQKQILQLLSPETISYSLKNKIMKMGLSKDKFLQIVDDITSSTYKSAMNKPNAYLSNIDIKYTVKENGHLPRLEGEALKKQQEEMHKFFKQNLAEIIRALKYIDKDTINQLMARRTELFKIMLDDLDELTDENYSLLSKLLKGKTINSPKDLSANEKIQLCKMVEIHQAAKIDMQELNDMAQSGIIDIDALKQKIKKEIFIASGIPLEKLSQTDKEKLNFNDKYFYLALASDKYIMENPEVYEFVFGELHTVIRESVLGDFNEFIFNPDNKYGQANKKTKEIFASTGLDYEKWLNPDIEDIKTEIGGKKMTFRLWDRNPYEDLFIGNKTTCCSAIGSGIHGESTPLFLLNTAFNVVELFDENNNAVGMSRVFMGLVDNKPSIIMDNIELNNNYIKEMNMDEIIKIRNCFFEYMNKYAKQVIKNDEPRVYFGTRSKHIPFKDLSKISANLDFIGSLSQEVVYINCSNSEAPYEIKNSDDVDFYIVPKTFE